MEKNVHENAAFRLSFALPLLLIARFVQFFINNNVGGLSVREKNE